MSRLQAWLASRPDPSKPHATRKFLLVLWGAVTGLTLAIIAIASLFGWGDLYRITITLVVMLAGLISISVMTPIITSVQLTANGLDSLDEADRQAADRSGTEALEQLLDEAENSARRNDAESADLELADSEFWEDGPDPRFKPSSRRSRR